MKKRKWLIILPDSPYPSTYGDTLLTSSFLAALNENNITFSLICTPKEIPDQESLKKLEAISERLWIIIRNYKIKNLLSINKPFQNASRSLPIEKEKEIIEHISTEDFDLIYCHGLYTFHLGHNLAKKSGLPLIQRSNNIESIFFDGLYKSTSFGLAKIYYLIEKFRFKALETKLIRGDFKSLKLVFELSYDDYLYHQKDSTVKIEFLPPFFNLKTLEEPKAYVKAGKELTLLYVGSLFSANNIHGLKYFLENIWKKITKKHKKINFTIIGSRPPEEFLSYIKKYEKVRVLSNVDSLLPYYKEAYLFINPIYYGSGINMKNIEALSYCVPVITTKVGARGLPWKDGEEIEQAVNDDDFALRIGKYIEDEALRNKLAINGFNYVVNNLNCKVNVERMLKIIDSIETK